MAGFPLQLLPDQKRRGTALPRFPACADRVIYWASDELHDYLSLELPRGGYEVGIGDLASHEWEGSVLHEQVLFGFVEICGASRL